MKTQFLAALASLMLCSCATEVTPVSGLDPAAFKTDSTALYVIRNAGGMEACITNYGARIVSLCVPDSAGVLRDVVVGFSDIATYTSKPTSYGALVGPYANRIARGRFTLDGTDYQLEINNGPNCLHGGSYTWRASCFNVLAYEKNSLSLGITKSDGQFSFPGEVVLSVTYTLTPDNRLDIRYEATTSAPTVLNVTNHSFFNLSGDPQSSARDNILFVDADSYTPTDETQIPTGELRDVTGTPFDFRTPKAIGQDIDSEDPQLRAIGGYDHNFVLNHPGDDSVIAASLFSPATGIRMDVYTEEPGIQVFTANNANTKLTFKDGKHLPAQSSVCLETQHFPDSPNHPEFPSTVLRPGEKFTSHTVYAFSCE